MMIGDEHIVELWFGVINENKIIRPKSPEFSF